MAIILKCKKCRMILVSSECFIVNQHGENIDDITKATTCEGKSSDVWYLEEDSIPSWMADQVDNENWLNGRIQCPSCNARIGHFDYINGKKCECKQEILPPVHLIKSKVDVGYGS